MTYNDKLFCFPQLLYKTLVFGEFSVYFEIGLKWVFDIPVASFGSSPLENNS